MGRIGWGIALKVLIDNAFRSIPARVLVVQETCQLVFEQARIFAIGDGYQPLGHHFTSAHFQHHIMLELIGDR